MMLMAETSGGVRCGSIWFGGVISHTAPELVQSMVHIDVHIDYAMS